ncbi:hypothetical protein OOZ51_13120 [Arthrobacter sp. MI7-26]|uniref:hypothetical protein n=1 Tax=Arthrobacter sp. MI7-26 TaxID=2993653 RepID=UPI00224928C7|nr:hypothetical protein [Arthrobacter sp. MI7-26]MCX2748746.1 hypothetical protein [Arthrobacter sp. MI7-26]
MRLSLEDEAWPPRHDYFLYELGLRDVAAVDLHVRGGQQLRAALQHAAISAIGNRTPTGRALLHGTA